MTTLPLTNTRSEPEVVVLARAVSWSAIILGLIVAVSSLTRLAAAWSHTAPRTFPDEYIYATLARSLAEGNGLVIRGTAAHFPALLQPLLTAPLWLVGDVDTAYRLTQGMHALAMSLAAVPVYWMARRIGAPSSHALACAAFTVALPSLVFSSYIMADPVAYPLVLCAIAAGTAALDRPTARNQAAFFAFTVLATFARVQYIVIPVAFLLAAVFVARGRPIAAFRSHRLLAILFATPALAVVALGPSRLLGYYQGVLSLDMSMTSMAHWAGVDVMLMAFVAGVAIVPGALAGIVAGLRGDAPRVHRVFAAFVASTFTVVVLEAAIYASNGSDRFQERYLMALLPLVSVAFCLGAKALPNGRWIAASTAVVLVLLSLYIPLSGYSALDGKQDSPFLMAVADLEQRLGIGTAGMVVAISITLLSAIAVIAAFRPRLGVPTALGAAILAASAASLGATSYDAAAATRMEATFSASGSWTWIDESGVGPASVLVTPGADRTAAEVQLFWNRDIRQVLRLPGAEDVDAFGSTRTAIAADGRLLAHGRPVVGPLLVEESFTSLLLDDARVVRRTPSATLWQPRKEARVAVMTIGRHIDGWLDPKAQITVWPRRDGIRTGVVELRLSLPPGVPEAVVQLHAPQFTRRVVVPPGGRATVHVPVSAVRPVNIALRGETAFRDNGRTIVAILDPPRLLEQSH